MITKPNGLVQIKSVYGNPIPYVSQKEHWESVVLETRALAKPIIYAYIGNPKITKIRAHTLVVDHALKTIEMCQDAGIPLDRMLYGGCYTWRMKRTNSLEPSTHLWGISFDWDPVNNPLGKKWVDNGWMLPKEFVNIWLSMGWTWGNEFPTPDPMHWQWAIGY